MAQAFFDDRLVAQGMSQNFLRRTGETLEPFPWTASELAALLDADEEAALRVGKTIDACRRVADWFYYGPNGPRGLLPQVRKRMEYLDDIFNSAMGWHKDRLLWWIKNVAACGAPDFFSDVGAEVHLVDMYKPSEVEAFVRRGRGVKECWGCDKIFEDRLTSRCSRCLEARYCSVDCQREHWRLHKRYCMLRTKQDLRLRP